MLGETSKPSPLPQPPVENSVQRRRAVKGRKDGGGGVAQVPACDLRSLLPPRRSSESPELPPSASWRRPHPSSCFQTLGWDRSRDPVPRGQPKPKGSTGSHSGRPRPGDDPRHCLNHPSVARRVSCLLLVLSPEKVRIGLAPGPGVRFAESSGNVGDWRRTPLQGDSLGLQRGGAPEPGRQAGNPRPRQESARVLQTHPRLHTSNTAQGRCAQPRM